jgi:hypothetical protein
LGDIWRDAWQSFKAALVPIVAGAGLILAIAGSAYVPLASVQVSVALLVVCAVTALVICVTAINMALASKQRGAVPRTLSAIRETDEGLTIVLSPSDLFGVDMAVAIYHVEQLELRGNLSFERLIGVGRVSNIQQNGLVQVSVVIRRPGHDQWLGGREAALLRQIVVKPSLPFAEAGFEVRINE